MDAYYVYILTNKNRSTLYIGVTNHLEHRVAQHRSKEVKGFTARYSLCVLLYYEVAPDPLAAIAREKQLKGWRREKKVALIEKVNPRWMDLAAGWGGEIVRDPSTALRPLARLRSAQDDGVGRGDADYL